jgi:hypothetical protein
MVRLLIIIIIIIIERYILSTILISSSDQYKLKSTIIRLTAVPSTKTHSRVYEHKLHKGTVPTGCAITDEIQS